MVSAFLPLSQSVKVSQSIQSSVSQSTSKSVTPRTNSNPIIVTAKQGNPGGSVDVVEDPKSDGEFRVLTLDKGNFPTIIVSSGYSVHFRHSLGKAKYVSTLLMGVH
jgi:hypothetical protein